MVKTKNFLLFLSEKFYGDKKIYMKIIWKITFLYENWLYL